MLKPSTIQRHKAQRIAGIVKQHQAQQAQTGRRALILPKNAPKR